MLCAFCFSTFLYLLEVVNIKYFLPFIAAFVIFSGDSYAHDPSGYEQIFGSPEDFIQDFEDNLKPRLNEYMGLGIAVTGFVLVLRSIF